MHKNWIEKGFRKPQNTQTLCVFRHLLNHFDQSCVQAEDGPQFSFIKLILFLSLPFATVLSEIDPLAKKGYMLSSVWPQAFYFLCVPHSSRDHSSFKDTFPCSSVTSGMLKLRFNGYIQPFEHVFFLFLQFLLAVHRLSGKHTLLQKWKKPPSTSMLGSVAMWPRFSKALMIWSRTGLFARRSVMRFCWIWILQRYEWMESFKYKIVYGVTDLICIEGKLTTGSQPSQS